MHLMRSIFFPVIVVALLSCENDTVTKVNSAGKKKPMENTTDTAVDSIELVYPSTPNPDDVRHAIIWLHGLGASANDFPPVVPHLGLDQDRPVQFIFPQAPDRPITINAGYVMPGWYDIRGLELSAKEDRQGLDESMQMVERTIAQLAHRGISPENIILAGFSQGGAVSYYTAVRTDHKLAGVLAMSTYLVFQQQTEDEQSGVNLTTPIFASHGTRDPVVSIDWGEQSVQKLESLGYRIDWETYAMEHEVSLPQIQAIGSWINHVFSSR